MFALTGWIKLHRKIQEHWLWQDKPFDKRSAWIDMLLMANHDYNKFLLGNELVEVERGSFITSEVKLAERWGWSRTKVRNFLQLLINDRMIEKKSDNRKTILTIENYSDYQCSDTTKEQQENSNETATEQQENTNKNEKNDKNKDYVSVFNFYLTLNLVKHRSYTNDMAKAIKKAIKDNKYEIEYCKELLKRHEIVVEKTKNLQYPVKARGFAEFFGQKVFGGTHLICSEYEEGGKYYEQHIKNGNQGNRLGVPPSESKLGKREEPWM